MPCTPRDIHIISERVLHTQKGFDVGMKCDFLREYRISLKELICLKKNIHSSRNTKRNTSDAYLKITAKNAMITKKELSYTSMDLNLKCWTLLAEGSIFFMELYMYGRYFSNCYFTFFQQILRSSKGNSRIQATFSLWNITFIEKYNLGSQILRVKKMLNPEPRT